MDCIASVRSDMSEFTALFDSWVQKITSDLHQQHTAHQHSVREATEEIDQLRHQHISLTQSHSQLNKGECLPPHHHPSAAPPSSVRR